MMKNYFLIFGMCLTTACVGRIEKSGFAVDFELTPELVQVIFEMATRQSRAAGFSASGLMVGGKRLTIISDNNSKLIRQHSDGVLTRSEAIILHGRVEAGESWFFFENKQGTMFKIE